MPDKTPKRQAIDLRDLLIAYSKQELLDPIKDSGRFIGFGLGGALVIALGIFFIAIGTLRMFVTEFESAFSGNLSVFSYFAVIALLTAGAVTCFKVSRSAPKDGPK